MRTWKVCLMAGILMLAVSACAARSGSGASLPDTRWTLVSYGVPGSETPVIEDAPVTLEFGKDGQAGGSGGCNSYGGPYSVQGDTLSFGQIVSTLMACVGEGVGDQETRYFQALATTGRFELAEDRLTIWYDNGQGVLSFVKAAQ